MKLRQYFLLIIAFCSAFALAIAQEQGDSKLVGIKCTTPTVATREGHQINVDFVMDLTGMPHLGRNLQMEITPVLVSNKTQESMELPIFVLTGATRGIMLKREMRRSSLHAYRRPGAEPLAIERRNNGKEQQLHYATRVPFAAWMKDAALVLRAKNTGCAGCPEGQEELVLVPNALSPLYTPSYRYSFIVPEGELLKRREESLTARINFIVDKYDIVPTLGNNPQELARVDEKMKEMINDSNITIDKLSMVGYASPEGGVEHNLILSRNRVNSFADYLTARYSRFKGKISTDAKGQDWAGLREAVEASSLPNKAEIFAIIDNTPVEARTEALKRLNRGETYAYMLHELYPPLRRSVVVFSFIVKGFNLEEAKEQIHRHPSRLSLAEVHAVASSYPKGSPEEYEAWEIAAKAFPKEAIPAINAAILDFEAGRYAQAVNLLYQYRTNPDLWGILGIAYAYNEQYEEAETYLKWAVQQNLPDAKYNLEEFMRFKEDNL